MNQIKYTEKQLLVLEILNEFDKAFKQDYEAYEFERKKYFDKIQKIKELYGIKEKFLTLREYLEKHSCGSYHEFHFSIDGRNVSDINGVGDFERFYNPNLLDKYYVLSDETESFGSTCENYHCDHHLKLVAKDD